MAGYARTFKQCRDKVKALKKQCNDVVDRLRRSGVSVQSDEEVSVFDFPWFGAIHAVMWSRVVTNPQDVVDSATPEPSSANQVSSNSSSSRVEAEEGEDSDVDLLIIDSSSLSTPTPLLLSLSTTSLHCFFNTLTLSLHCLKVQAYLM